METQKEKRVYLSMKLLWKLLLVQKNHIKMTAVDFLTLVESEMKSLNAKEKI